MASRLSKASSVSIMARHRTSASACWPESPPATKLARARFPAIPFGFMMPRPSDRPLGSFDVEAVEVALGSAPPAHPARFDAADRGFRRRERETVDADHAGFDPRHRLANTGGVAGE